MHSNVDIFGDSMFVQPQILNKLRVENEKVSFKRWHGLNFATPNSYVKTLTPTLPPPSVTVFGNRASSF